MARESMADLIARLRGLIGDPNDDDPTLAAFTDDRLQELLDARKTVVVEAALRTLPSGPSLTYVDFFAPRGWWEDSVVLSGVSGDALTPDTADLVSGHWTFTAGTGAPVYISGSFFDIYGSAQAALEEWAAKVAREFDFATDQQSFDRTGKREGLLAVAREYARKASQPGRRPAWRSSTW